MNDVFISYARSTEARAKLVDMRLREAGYNVWRDDSLPAHRPYTDVIEEHLATAKSVLVVWSAAAVKSEWVRSEADIGRHHSKLVQVAIDPCNLPLPFGQFECANLANWSGDPLAPEWQKVLSSVSSLVAAADAQALAAGERGAQEDPSLSVCTRARLPLPDKPSIAVLPLRNAKADKANEFLAEALTDAIVTELSRWRWFFVISHRSSLRFKERDIVEASRELGVRYILDGSIAVSGNIVRIRARLVDAVDGTTVWAEKFDREMSEVLDLEDEIAQRVVAAIAPVVVHGVGARVARRALSDVSVIESCYRGIWQLNQMTAAAAREALIMFREAVARDPSLPLAQLGLARALYAAAVFGASQDPKHDLNESREAARRAIALDPQDAGGYFALAGASLYLGDHGTALRNAQLAVELNHNFCYAHYRLGQVLIFCGRPQEAIVRIKDAIRLSPYDPQMGLMLETLALAHYQALDYTAAAAVAKSASLTTDGRSAVLAASLARLGRVDDAVRALPERTLRPSLDRPLVAPYGQTADREHLREGVKLAAAGLPVGD